MTTGVYVASPRGGQRPSREPHSTRAYQELAAHLPAFPVVRWKVYALFDLLAVQRSGA